MHACILNIPHYTLHTTQCALYTAQNLRLNYMNTAHWPDNNMTNILLWFTRMYSPQRGISSSSCEGLWPFAKVFFSFRQKKLHAVFSIWPELSSPPRFRIMGGPLSWHTKERRNGRKSSCLILDTGYPIFRYRYPKLTCTMFTAQNLPLMFTWLYTLHTIYSKLDISDFKYIIYCAVHSMHFVFEINIWFPLQNIYAFCAIHCSALLYNKIKSWFRPLHWPMHVDGK